MGLVSNFSAVLVLSDAQQTALQALLAPTDSLTFDLEVYVVGGAVRDALLGYPGSDRDWVVVGATPEQLAARGFKPVGSDFPVFLHPVTHEEYALARTERKSGQGYKGFVFQAAADISLEQDLQRRDLTINAIALSLSGALIDPFQGQTDLQQQCLRHVSDAFVEDPVRLLRLARFAARFAHFTIASETQAVAQQLAASGELDALVAERVWQELARALMSTAPQRFFEVLQAVDAAQRVLPDLIINPKMLSTLAALATAANAEKALSLDSRWMLCLWETFLRDPTSVEALNDRLRVPRHCRQMSNLLKVASRLDRRCRLTPVQQVDTWLKLDGRRQPARAKNVLDVIAAYDPGFDQAHYAAAFDTLAQLPTTAVVSSLAQPTPMAIQEALHSAYVAALVQAC